jgi:tetratricopeptide (TPR) repeat protein
MMKEAQVEFEKVVRSIPDNLFAHKKLADIYRDTGNRDLAVKEYRTVLKLNAMDEEALSSLNDIEQTSFGPPGEEAGTHEAPLAEEAPAEPMLGEEPLFEESGDKTASSETGSSEPLSGEMSAAAGLHEDELSSFKDSLFGGKAASDEGLHEALGLKADVPMEVNEESFEISEDEEVSFSDINDPLQSSGAAPAGEAAGAAMMFGKGSVREEEKPDMGPVKKPVEAASMEDANIMVSQGNYAGAMNIYRSILSADPNDRKVLQSIEELKSLLKFLGKDKEVLVGKLNSFMEGIKKRQDEFHRSP